MKVSFYVPIYKKSLDQLKKCLGTLLDQSHKDVEVVCVFDGEDPIVESYVDKLAEEGKVKKVNIEHGGACKARNAGLKVCTGDLVCAWDADCYIEPDTTALVLKEFESPDVDMVYTGYRYTNPELPGHNGEPFDAFTLSKYNYISSMSFIKRDKAPEWNEELKGLQDWDYARRCVQNGVRPRWLQAFGFSTDMPDKNSISGPGVDVQARIEEVRKRWWGDKDKDVLINADAFRYDAVRLAKILDADTFNGPYYIVRNYKLGIHVGCVLAEAVVDDMKYVYGIVNMMKTCEKKAIFWMGIDAEKLYASRPFGAAIALVKFLNDSVDYHFCDDKVTQGRLDDLGIKAELVNFPVGEGDVHKTLPEEFKMLVFTDDVYGTAMGTVMQALPGIKFDNIMNVGNVDIRDYSGIIQFTKGKRLEMLTKLMLVNGRYPITNVPAPYSGYLSTDKEVTPFINDMINRIKEIEAKTEVNKEAQDYYLDLWSGNELKEKVSALIGSPVLEVVS
jgi:glycosyltransferase involved in cell wall biosynthesis